MTPLQARFKTNLKAMSEGNWFDLGANGDKEKTICRFRLARISEQNTEYEAYTRKISEPYAPQIALGVLDLEIDKKLFMDGVIEKIVIDWENFQPEEVGKNVEFSRENVRKYLSDPEWYELYNWITSTARNVQGFREYNGDTIVKN